MGIPSKVGLGMDVCDAPERPTPCRVRVLYVLRHRTFEWKDDVIVWFVRRHLFVV
jgi:hypothetical protein